MYYIVTAHSEGLQCPDSKNTRNKSLGTIKEFSTSNSRAETHNTALTFKKTDLRRAVIEIEFVYFIWRK
jgi:hypothetical protein